MSILVGIAAKAVLGNTIKTAIKGAVTAVARDNTVTGLKPVATAVVTAAVLDKLESNPAFVNATNSERWFQSGVAMGFNGVTAGALAIVLPEVFTHGYHLARYNWPVMGPSVLILASAGFGYVRRFWPGLKPLFSKA